MFPEYIAGGAASGIAEEVKGVLGGLVEVGDCTAIDFYTSPFNLLAVVRACWRLIWDTRLNEDSEAMYPA